jgi:hypothetical protein
MRLCGERITSKKGLALGKKNIVLLASIEEMPPKSPFLALSPKYVWDVALEEVVFHSHRARPTAFEILLSVANATFYSTDLSTRF